MKGHQGHQGHGHQGHVVVVKKAHGGKVEGVERKEKPMEDERTEEMEKREMRGEKRGGAVKGGAAKHRPDKRARGGRMTPKEPMSGAGNMTKMSYEGSYSSNDTGGKGREPRPS
jgi:hypothetical protein